MLVIEVSWYRCQTKPVVAGGSGEMINAGGTFYMLFNMILNICLL